jgi:DNA helicase-2/ATP-dependent DNA helicase PcrA
VGPVVIRAGAGSGKTRTISHRIAHAVESGVVEANQVLGLTFTTRAAGALRARLREMGISGVQVRTFHSAAYRQLQYFYPKVFNQPVPNIVTSKAQWVSAALTACGQPTNSERVRDIAAEIEWAKANVLSPELYQQRGVKRQVLDLGGAEVVARVYAAYGKVLDEAGLIDYEDVLLTMLAIMENFPEIAATVRAQYRYFVVDEFQDVSPLQFELLNTWLGNRRDICVVGDAAQTIYSFSGATSEYLENFARYFPNSAEFEITNTYRCAPAIATRANKILQRNSAGSLRLNSVKSDEGKVTIREFATDHEQAQKVANEIAQQIASGVAPRDIAVLFRINAQSEAIETQLANLGIAYNLRGAERFFERREVRAALIALKTLGPMPQSVVEQTMHALRQLGWQEMAPAGRSARETWESLDALVGLSYEFNDKSMTDFIRELELRQTIEHVPSANVVTLATIHAAKGLEWEHVYVIGCSEGLLPLTHANTADELAEERRLFYVALTRAASSLTLTWASSRNDSVRSNRKPSPFLLELGD